MYLFVTTGTRLENHPLVSGHKIRATGVNQPNILQIFHLKFKNEHVSEQTTQLCG
jgi:hypothetical protein